MNSRVREILDELAESGLSAHQLVLIAELINECHTGELPLTPRLPTPGAIRMRRYRERHEASLCDGCDVTVTDPFPPSDGSPIPPPITTPHPEIPQKPSVSPPKAEKRAKRLPQDWNPSETLWAWGLEQGLSNENLRFETSAFRDHFWASGRANARKLDWDKTWKNWMRSNVRNKPRSKFNQPTSLPSEYISGAGYKITID